MLEPESRAFAHPANVALRASGATVAAVCARGADGVPRGWVEGAVEGGAALLAALQAASFRDAVGRARLCVTDIEAPGGWHDERLAAALRSAGVRAFAAVEADSGVALVGAPEPRTWEPQVVALLEDLARLAGLLHAADAEARYRRLVEASPDPIAVHADGRVVFVNQTAVRALGAASASDVIGRPISDFIDAAFLAQAAQRVPEMLRTGQPAPVIPGTFRCLDGTILHGDVASTPTVFDGRPAIQVVIRDATARLATEQALRRSEATLRALFDGAAVGISQVSVAGEYVDVNPTFARLMGETRQAIRGRSFREYTHPDDLEKTEEMHRRLVTREVPWTQIEKRYVRRDGSILWGRLTASAVPTDEDTVYVVGMVEDITAHKAAEEALKESEARFRSLIEHSSDLIAIMDPAARLLYQSSSAERLLGYSVDDLMAMDIFELVHPEDVDAVKRAFGAVLENGGIATAEYRIRDVQGRWLTLQSTAENRLDDVAVRGIVVNTRDVTAARELEAQLLQSQKIEAVGRLAGGIAHDFNNILTAVQGHASILADELPPGSPHLGDVEQIQRSAERAASLTRQLLAFSRRQILQPKVLDLNAILLETDRMLRRLIGEDVDLFVEMDHALGRIKADPAQVQQVLLNLAVNARDAMPGGGRLEIRTADVVLTDEAARQFADPVVPGRYALLSVSDTGNGMQPEIVDHIFEPFFTTKPPGQGTGLGLSSVYGTVKQSGGHIAVDTGVGFGTTFRIYLPCVQGDAAEPATRRSASRPRGSGVVLLVEDEPAVRSLARRVLEGGGYTVLEATDGEHALEVCRDYDGPIDLVLTDVVMPRLGGADLALRLADLRPQTRVMFMSGYAEDALTRRGVALGSGFLHKPFSPELLRRRVAEVLAAPR